VRDPLNFAGWTLRGLFRCLLLLACSPLETPAQPVPSVGQCATWSRQLGRGGTDAMSSLRFGWFAGCSTTGPSDLATAIANSKAVSDTAYLWALVRQAGELAHPSVFDAAIANARNPDAAAPSISASLLILTAQLGFAPHVGGTVPFSELTEAAPATGLCGPEIALSGPPGPAVRALPPNHRRRVAALLDALHAQSASAQVRNLARCLRTAVGEIPPQVDVSGVTLTYQGCNRFIVDNPTAYVLPMGVDVPRTGEHFGWSAAPGRSVFSTRSEGTVGLSYDGVVIRTAANGGGPC
jgi:hypothetical protein